MEKWEYKVEYLMSVDGVDSDKQLESQLNKLGLEGWELVHYPGEILTKAADGFAVFKRKIK